MKFSLFVALRYLFSKKKQNAINIISLISVIGVAIGSAALIVILSVFNGIDTLIVTQAQDYNADLYIVPSKGKFVAMDSLEQQLRSDGNIASLFGVIEEKALFNYKGKMIPVVVKGVDSTYIQATAFAKYLQYASTDTPLARDNQAIPGIGLAYQAGMRTNELQAITLHYPKRKASNLEYPIVNMEVYPVAYFSSGQEDENKTILVQDHAARLLFGLTNEVSKLEVRLHDKTTLQAEKAKIQYKIGNDYRVEDIYDINASFYAMLKSEKLAVFFILLFILLIASFNIIGSITMLIIDKKEDLYTYKSMGIQRSQLIRIFCYQGNLITLFGVIVGILFGTGLALLQQHYGFIKLGDGSYLIEAYPVKLFFSDVVYTFIAVLGIGFLASYFPVVYLIKRLTGNK